MDNVSINELPAIYKLSSLFVYPSIFEGFGIPILESLYCRTPVISSNGSSLTEAGGYHTKYVDPSNYEEFAFQIEECLTNEGSRSEMIKMDLNMLKILIQKKFKILLMPTKVYSKNYHIMKSII